MTTKNVCVIVPDKVVSVDGESYVLDTWSFGDSKIWAEAATRLLAKLLDHCTDRSKKVTSGGGRLRACGLCCSRA